MTTTRGLRIRVAEEIGSRLILRDSVKSIFTRVRSDPTERVVLDFSGVQFMSRSFAHEYLVNKDASGKVIIEENSPDEVRKMLELVGRQIEAARREKDLHPPRFTAPVAPVSSV